MREYYDMYQTRKMPDASQCLSIDFVVIDGVVVVACCWHCLLVAGEMTAEKVVSKLKEGTVKAPSFNK